MDARGKRRCRFAAEAYGCANIAREALGMVRELGRISTPGTEIPS